jgi:acyl-CoA dehydrogenase
VPENVLADIQDALIKTITAEPIEKQIKAAKKEGDIDGYTAIQQAQSALEKNIITVEQFDIIMQAEEARKKVIAVDDFLSEELERTVSNITTVENMSNYANTGTTS